MSHTFEETALYIEFKLNSSKLVSEVWPVITPNKTLRKSYRDVINGFFFVPTEIVLYCDVITSNTFCVVRLKKFKLICVFAVN